MIDLHFSYYWLLVPLVVALVWWVAHVAEGDTGGYGAGLATLLALAVAVIIFFVVLAAMLAFSLWFR